MTRADAALTTAVNDYVAEQTEVTAKALRDQINVADSSSAGTGVDPALVEYMSHI